ncbi:hypothetical protein ACUXGS_000713 [Staphylococcus hominis]
MLAILLVSLLITVLVIFSMYLALVLFTYIRAMDFKVHLSGFLSFIIPIHLIIMHFQMYNDWKEKDKKKARQLLFFVFKKYPVALTRLMVIICHDIAEIKVLDDKEVEGINLKDSKISKDSNEVVNFKSIWKNNKYKDRSAFAV